MSLASRALRHDPGCKDAHLLLAHHAPDEESRMAHLVKAVETGDGLWSPVAAKEGADMCWWGSTATRPYMRASQALRMAHMANGDVEEARESFDRLLRMNPDDNQGIRFQLAAMGAAASVPAM